MGRGGGLKWTDVLRLLCDSAVGFVHKSRFFLREKDGERLMGDWVCILSYCRRSFTLLPACSLTSCCGCISG